MEKASYEFLIDTEVNSLQLPALAFQLFFLLEVLKFLMEFAFLVLILFFFFNAASVTYFACSRMPELTRLSLRLPA